MTYSERERGYLRPQVAVHSQLPRFLIVYRAVWNVDAMRILSVCLSVCLAHACIVAKR